ncbi:hypothetical protein B0I35DRAFT_481628 [Stachybotrys elegans]|uniref:Survival Motor Neuron Gemin2-binding domain-containing protein n=1 Tax=Stachybotrys elegans TaxID=80388 RepID=A0A8K0WNR6_9HYPO|nr:hypothetical protein B0I35DRAFT_481628 [Stachybotrys elegans]
MASKAIDMSQDEIWDDSMLIDSWNQALEEYKKYHSIHAKGGKVRQLEEMAQETSRNTPQAGAVDDQPGETEAERNTGLAGDRSVGNQVAKIIRAKEPAVIAKEKVLDDDAQREPVPGFSPPQAVLGSVRDENLKKLLMSWYYAGYYTGLYEGQQQQQQGQSQ